MLGPICLPQQDSEKPCMNVHKSRYSLTSAGCASFGCRTCQNFIKINESNPLWAPKYKTSKQVMFLAIKSMTAHYMKETTYIQTYHPAILCKPSRKLSHVKPKKNLSDHDVTCNAARQHNIIVSVMYNRYCQKNQVSRQTPAFSGRGLNNYVRSSIASYSNVAIVKVAGGHCNLSSPKPIYLDRAHRNSTHICVQLFPCKGAFVAQYDILCAKPDVLHST